MMQAEHVSVRRGSREVTRDISLEVRSGEWWMIAGPNGAGKTTLLEALSGALPYTGTVRVEGRELRELRSGERARKIGVLSQNHASVYDYTVEEVVSLGRYSREKSYFGGRDEHGAEKIEEALRATGLSEMRGRGMLTLSGGEAQRVYLAQVLAQDPKLLMLDEPANHLDPPYQQRFFEMIRRWASEPGRAVITVTHDLTLARRYGTHGLLMREGRCAASGRIEAALAAERLREVYGMDIAGWMQEALALWK